MGSAPLRGLQSDLFVKKPIREKFLYIKFTEALTGRSVERAPKLVNDMATNPLSILIAEDNKANQKVIQKILQRGGFLNITIVDDGNKAVQAMREKQFSVILMDIMMPEMSGWEATQIIRQQIPKERQPKIIALTANAFSSDIEKCLNVGMNDVLTKPINPKLLIEKLNSIQSCCS